MPTSDPVLLAVGGAAVVSLVGVLWLVLTVGRDPVEDRLSNLQDDHRKPGGSIRSDADAREIRKAWSQKEERRHKLGDRLVQAGLYRRNSTVFFYTIQIALGALPVAVGVGASMLGITTPRAGLLIGVMTGMAGIVAPGLWLDYQKKSRQTAIRRALPDALDLLVVCVEAGLSLPAALVRVTKELRTAYPMLAMELIIVHREVQLGHSTGEALRRFADRFDLEELRSLSSVVRQAERFGASIVNALRVHAETLRHKRVEQARERAQKATVKVLFPTILCIFPAIFVVVVGPAALGIIEMFSNLNAGR